MAIDYGKGMKKLGYREVVIIITNIISMPAAQGLEGLH